MKFMNEMLKRLEVGQDNTFAEYMWDILFRIVHFCILTQNFNHFRHFPLRVTFVYHSPLKLRLPLIFAIRLAQNKGSALQSVLRGRKLEVGENFVFLTGKVTMVNISRCLNYIKYAGYVGNHFLITKSLKSYFFSPS